MADRSKTPTVPAGRPTKKSATVPPPIPRAARVTAKQQPAPPQLPPAPAPKQPQITSKSHKTPGTQPRVRAVSKMEQDSKDFPAVPRELATGAERERPRVRLRAMSDVASGPHMAARPEQLGHLAPPRDPREVRARRRGDLVVWGSVCVIIACAIALVIWFVA